MTVCRCFGSGLLKFGDPCLPSAALGQCDEEEYHQIASEIETADGREQEGKSPFSGDRIAHPPAVEDGHDERTDTEEDEPAKLFASETSKADQVHEPATKVVDVEEELLLVRIKSLESPKPNMLNGLPSLYLVYCVLPPVVLVTTVALFFALLAISRERYSSSPSILQKAISGIRSPDQARLIGRMNKLSILQCTA